MINWKINRTINYWLWTKGWANRKQYPKKKNNTSILDNIETYKNPRKERKYFIIGLLIGYIPYIVHMQGWLK
jgi:hypothetical protein